MGRTSFSGETQIQTTWVISKIIFRDIIPLGELKNNGVKLENAQINSMLILVTNMNAIIIQWDTKMNKNYR